MERSTAATATEPLRIKILKSALKRRKKVQLCYKYIREKKKK